MRLLSEAINRGKQIDLADQYYTVKWRIQFLTWFSETIPLLGSISRKLRATQIKFCDEDLPN